MSEGRQGPTRPSPGLMCNIRPPLSPALPGSSVRPQVAVKPLVRTRAAGVAEAPSTSKSGGPIIMNGQVLHSLTDERLEIVRGMSDWVETNVGVLVWGWGCTGGSRQNLAGHTPSQLAAVNAPSCTGVLLQPRCSTSPLRPQPSAACAGPCALSAGPHAMHDPGMARQHAVDCPAMHDAAAD